MSRIGVNSITVRLLKPNQDPEDGLSPKYGPSGAKELKGQNWEGVGESRHGALKKGGDEKLTTKRLRGKRVAVKALPGRPLLLGPTPVHLPPGASLDLDRHWLVEHCTHDSVLLIENWENFELTHETPFLHQVPGNPLVVISN